MEYADRHRVYFIESFPIDAFATQQHMRSQYNNTNPNFTALRFSISKVGVLDPLFADHINGQMFVGVGKQRLIACEDLRIPFVSLVFTDTDGCGASAYANLNPIRILSQAQGQEYFTDSVEFSMGRFVSVTKNIRWES